MKTNIFTSIAGALLIFTTAVYAQQQKTDAKSTITTKSGKTYKAAVISKVYADSVLIKHSAGISRVDISDLSANLQLKYDYDPKKAAAAKKERHIKEAAQQKNMLQQKKAIASQIRANQKQAEKEEKLKAQQKSAKRQTYKILQVVDQGLLVQKYVRGYYESSLQRSVSSLFGGSNTYTPPTTSPTVWRMTGENQPELADGDVITAWTIEDGTSQYTTTRGAKKTVRNLIALKWGKVEKP